VAKALYAPIATTSQFRHEETHEDCVTLFVGARRMPLVHTTPTSSITKTPFRTSRGEAREIKCHGTLKERVFLRAHVMTSLAKHHPMTRNCRKGVRH